MMFDEPTNHLDLDTIEWLEQSLSASNITVLLVTHDRYFLQRVCNQIIELERGHLHEYSGNYNYYLTKKAERLEQDHKDTHIMKQLYRRELARVKKAPRARETKSRKREQEFIFEKYSTGYWKSIWLWLGLYLCKKIVELHSWTIKAWNSKKLGWAMISIVIPKYQKKEN